MNQIEIDLVNRLQQDTLNHNDLAKIAKEDNRDYITPEDVSTAIALGIPNDKIRLDVLEVIGNQSGFGIEDYKLTAWVAFQGKEI